MDSMNNKQLAKTNGDATQTKQLELEICKQKKKTKRKGYYRPETMISTLGTRSENWRKSTHLVHVSSEMHKERAEGLTSYLEGTLWRKQAKRDHFQIISSILHPSAIITKK